MTISPTFLGKYHNYLRGFTSAPNVGNQCVLIMSRMISKFLIFLLKLLVTTWITCWTEIWVEEYVILVWRFGNIFKPNCDLPLAKQFKMAIYATILTHVLALQWNIFLKFVIRIHVSQIKKERGFFTFLLLKQNQAVLQKIFWETQWDAYVRVAIDFHCELH